MALDLIGANQGCTSVGNLTPPSPIGALSFWAQADVLSGVQRIIATSDSFEGRFDGTTLWADWGISGGNALSLGTFATGSLYHCVCNYNTTTGAAEAYRTGVLVDTSTDRNGVSGAASFSLGARPTDTNPFNGKLADVRIYNRFLTANEVMELYRMRGSDTLYSGLVHRWPLQEGANATSPSGTGSIKDVVGGVHLTPSATSPPVYIYGAGLHSRRPLA